MSVPKAVLLDRDGTIIEECHYLSDPGQVRLIPGAGRALKRLAESGARLFLVSNQSGIGRGFFTLEDYRAVHARLEQLLLQEGVRLSGHAFCPHAPEEQCSCRKPGIGMWKALSAEHGLQAKDAVMIGDKRADVEFGFNAGLGHVVMVRTGHGAHETEQLGICATSKPLAMVTDKANRPFALAQDLPAAADWLLSLVRNLEK
ncbi:MAG: D-glycero-alpha-D-manno-heptose-1,7-bisphosphate 7-phosphatase [Desulfovibrionales bacterium]